MRAYYDLHIHTALSPCADDDNTPNNIVNMAKLKNLDVIAITDHNSCGNVESCMKVGESVGLLVIPGMELTTAEEIHVVCLFASVANALEFWNYVKKSQMKVKNKPEIFGRELYLDENDEIVGEEDMLLITSTSIDLYEVASLVKKLGGVCFPSHVDREGSGVIPILNALTPDMGFTSYEYNGVDEGYIEKYNLASFTRLKNSDAHTLYDIHENDIDKTASYFEVEKLTIEEIFAKVQNIRCV